MKCVLIPAKLDKHSGCVGEESFAKTDEQRIMGVGSRIASTVTARYYKGLAAHGDNLVIVRTLYE